MVDHRIKDWSTSGVVTSTGLVGLSAVRGAMARRDDIVGCLKEDGGANGDGLMGCAFCSVAAGVSFILAASVLVIVLIAAGVFVSVVSVIMAFGNGAEGRVEMRE